MASKDNLETNFEPFTPENIAKWLMLKFGDQASLQAAQKADYFCSKNDFVAASIWCQVMKFIDAHPRELQGTPH